jgi:hypothetical protein
MPDPRRIPKWEWRWNLCLHMTPRSPSSSTFSFTSCHQVRVDLNQLLIFCRFPVSLRHNSRRDPMAAPHMPTCESLGLARWSDTGRVTSTMRSVPTPCRAHPAPAQCQGAPHTLGIAAGAGGIQHGQIRNGDNLRVVVSDIRGANAGSPRGRRHIDKQRHHTGGHQRLSGSHR